MLDMNMPLTLLAAMSNKPEHSQNAFTLLKQKFLDFITDPALWTNIGVAAAKIIIIIIASRIIIQLSRRLIQHFLERKEQNPNSFNQRRTKTITRLIGNIIGYTVNFFAIILIFTQLGFNLVPLLAGAGVVGLAIGFGAQSLVKDIITGFFIILEDQFAVGDNIQTGNFRGTVEEIGLRVTRLKNWTGEVHIIPNGQILEVTNFSVSNSVAFVDIKVAYETDIDQAMRIIGETVSEMYRDDENLVKEPEVLGVQALGPSEVVLRVIAECKPMTNLAVARRMNVKIKKALDCAGIEIPYPKMVTYQRTERV